MRIASGVPFADAAGGSEVYVAVVDTERFNEVRPDIPQLDGAASPIPILVSDDWAERIVPRDLELAGEAVTIAGVLPRDALPGVSRRWVIVDAAAVDRLDHEFPDPEQVFVRLDPGADSAAVAGANSSDASSTLAVMVNGLLN